MNRILFVTGTDTSIGKTVCSAVLCAEALESGTRVRYCKPIQTGVGPGGEGSDVATVLSLVRRFSPDTSVAPPLPVGSIDTPSSAFTGHELSRYEEPLAPAIAATRAGTPVMMSRLVKAIASLAKTCDLLVVEGAGGLLVPLTANATMADMAKEIDAPIVIVASPSLGTLNHTLLTVEAAKKRSLSIDRIMLTPWPDKPGTLEETNLRWLRTNTQVRIVTIPAV